MPGPFRERTLEIELLKCCRRAGIQRVAVADSEIPMWGDDSDRAAAREKAELGNLGNAVVVVVEVAVGKGKLAVGLDWGSVAVGLSKS